MRARLLLICGIVVVSAAVLEIGARLLGLGHDSRGSKWYAGGNHPQFLFQADRDAGYVLRPGFAGEEIAASGDFRLPIAIDARGVPVRTSAREGPDGVLAIGDSMTFGEGVAQEDTWTARLEHGIDASVTNGGVPGYSSAQMAARARQLLPLVHPRLVLMSFFPLWDRWRCDDPLAYKDGFIVIRSFADKLHLVHGNLYQEIVRGPRLGAWSAHALGASAFLRALVPQLTDRGIAARASRRPSWSTYASCLDAIRATQQIAEGAGAAFRVVLIEGATASPPETADVERRLAELGVPFISLDQLMKERDESTLRYHDGHWNTAGHAAVAEVLTPMVRDLLERGGARRHH